MVDVAFCHELACTASERVLWLMFGLSVKARLALGLLGILASILLIASFLGFNPFYQRTLLDDRARICELIAMNTTALAAYASPDPLRDVIQETVRRNDDILSAAVRRQDGTLVVMAGDHATCWKALPEGKSTATQIRLPLRDAHRQWGHLELCFSDATALAGGLRVGPAWRMLALVSATCGIVFFFVVGKSLEHLDPSEAVPQQVRGALDQLAEGLVITDRQGRVAFVNETLSRWQGKRVQDLIGQHVNDFDLRFAEETQGKAMPWMNAMREERPQSGVSLLFTDADNRERHLKAYSSPVLGNDGACHGVLTSFEDITALVNSKAALSQAKHEAEEANRTKTDFLARMSHEIRTPMNAILGYTEVLLYHDDESRSERQEYLENIYSGGEHLLALINSILDISKIEAGHMQLEQIADSPYRLMTQAIALVRKEADAKGVTLEFHCDSLPRQITTDPTRFRQIIVNLLSNAVKFTDAGSVSVSARVRPGKRGWLARWKAMAADDAADVHQDVLEIIVEDSGIGMDEDVLNNIFEPFSQADTSITRRFGGTGLGLPICLRLAEAMGGKITAESEIGVGSKFTVRMPYGSAEQAEMVPREVLAAGLQQEPVQPEWRMRLPKCRILVVDDGESNRNLFALILRRAGAVVECVENGLDGYALAIQEDFDIILMDMQMPVMDGYTAVSKLRAAGYERPVIALTAHAMLGDEAKCLEAGCTRFITKPVESSKLVSTIAELLPVSAEASAEDADFEVSTEWARMPRQSSQRTGIPVHSETADEDAIYSALPTEDDEFRDIVVEFMERLQGQMVEVGEACHRQDFAAVADFAHRLKGSGGTAGFGELTAPACELEEVARLQDWEAMQVAIERIEGIVQRIEVPAKAVEVTAATSNWFPLPAWSDRD